MASQTTYQCEQRGLSPIVPEYIEPYLKAMLSVELESLHYNPTEKQLEESKQNLRGVERFIQRFGGLHSRIAISNVYHDFYKLKLEDVIKLNEEYDKENNL